MRLVADSGVWSTEPLTAATPLIAVLEVNGALLSWTVDDPQAAAHITLTDVARADWLWRIVGQSGHLAVAAAIDGRSPVDTDSVDVSASVIDGSLELLRRLALGHWLRRWWPASHRDGIAVLNAVVLDAEVALLTAAAQDFLAEDNFDSDVAELIRPHAVALGSIAREGDPRISELVRACAELAADVGVEVDVDSNGEARAAARRDDYALAAGSDRASGGAAVATGVSSMNWAAVPPGVFDAAEGTVEWRVEPSGSTAHSVVSTQLSGGGSPAGIAVGLRSGTIAGTGSLDADGIATLQLFDDQLRSVTESAAWDHDWRTTVVTIGAEVDESPETRERVRDFARFRLRDPGGDAFLAELLAAEADY
jgi:hypothetical protein